MRQNIRIVTARSFSRQLFYILGIFICLSYENPIRAQQDPRGLPPPKLSSVDENGVDLASGRFPLRFKWPLIGKDTGLPFLVESSYVAEVGDYSNFWGIVEQVSSPVPYSQQYLVRFGTTSATFRIMSNGSVVLIKGSGGEKFSLSSGGPFATFADRNGISVTYRATTSSPVRFYPLTVYFPSGEYWTYSYRPFGVTSLLAAIYSSSGYGLRVDRNSSGYVVKYTTFNRSIEYCAIDAISCIFQYQ